MKIQLIDGSTRFSGGRRMLFLHANELVRRGHDVTLWVEKDPQFDWLPVSFSVRTLEGKSLKQLPPSDLCLFQRWRFARPVRRARRGIPVHFCQGFEGTDAENRLASAWEDPWENLPELWKLWRRLRWLEKSYAAPTVKIVVHQPLRDLLAKRFGQSAYLVPYGLDDAVFQPASEPVPATQNILVVGPSSIGWKRIHDALDAVRILKQRRPGVRLIRVSPEAMDSTERQFGVTDEYHIMLSSEQMAEQYRRAAVLAVPSDATEGFGLPALEAMACGTPVVLTDIPSFRAFASPNDYAQFVPVGRPELMAQALDWLLDDKSEYSRRERARQIDAGLEVAARYTLGHSYQAMSDALTEIVRKGWRRVLPASQKQSA
jgi:glycosyltransferase involved in cell wall biosynthesis